MICANIISLVTLGVNPLLNTNLMELAEPLASVHTPLVPPKFTALPKVEIVTKSIVDPAPLLFPPAKIHLTAFESDAISFLATVKSPKSAALPKVDIVIKFITLVFAGLYLPPAIIPLVGD